MKICDFIDKTIDRITILLMKARNQGVFAKINDWGRSDKDRDRVLTRSKDTCGAWV